MYLDGAVTPSRLEIIAVLPSRSAVSDLGLISDLFEKMLVNWSSFCLKSLLFGLKRPRSVIFTLSAFHNNILNFGFVSNKI